MGVCDPEYVKLVRNVPLRVEGGIQVMLSCTCRSDPGTREDITSSSVTGIGAVLCVWKRKEI